MKLRWKSFFFSLALAAMTVPYSPVLANPGLGDFVPLPKQPEIKWRHDGSGGLVPDINVPTKILVRDKKLPWDPDWFVEHSEAIYICEYMRFEEREVLSKDRIKVQELCAFYRVKEQIKGPCYAKNDLPVRFEFRNWHSTRDSIIADDFKAFDSSAVPGKSGTTIPQEGSSWIIFIRDGLPVNGMFETFKGSAGRVEYTKENLDKLMVAVEKHKGKLEQK